MIPRSYEGRRPERETRSRAGLLHQAELMEKGLVRNKPGDSYGRACWCPRQAMFGYDIAVNTEYMCIFFQTLPYETTCSGFTSLFRREFRPFVRDPQPILNPCQ
jgi:hypothetical protein